jgi:CheY-like chemotaxis protein
MVNLISNAHKYSDINSHIIVVFSTECENILNIQVIDEGIGIPIDKMEGLYNTFSRLHTENNQDGSGLGLAICKKLSILLGGNMSVMSSEKKGSIFTSTFKFMTCDDVEKDIHESYEIMEGRQILVVDDNIDNRILIADQLHAWGVIPTMVASAKEAISIVSNNRYRFDIGLIDICMPDMDGVELAALIKKERPLLPLIALSSLDAFDHGCDFECKLNKPINKIQLYDKIQRSISSSILPDMVSGPTNGHNTSPIIRLPETNNCRILIAEDVAYNRDVLSQLVKQIGYNNIDFAVDGSQAIEKMHKAVDECDPYKVLLLDLGMPVMNGFEVIDYITEIKWKLPKIIVVTADVVQGESSKCKDLGVNYFVTKPVDYKSLKRVMIQASSSML